MYFDLMMKNSIEHMSASPFSTDSHPMVEVKNTFADVRGQRSQKVYSLCIALPIFITCFHNKNALLGTPPLRGYQKHNK